MANHSPPRFKFHISTAIASVIVLIFIGTFTFSALEGWNYVQSFYFSVSTFSTVGYGDFVPSNDLSRLAASMYILAGMGIFFGSISVMGSKYITFRSKVLNAGLQRKKR